MRCAPAVLASLAATSLLGCGAKSGLAVTDGETGPDASVLVDAGPVDSGEDVAPDAPPDVTLDVVPEIGPPPSCDDAGATYVYVVTEQQTLLRFDPPSATFATIGTVSCPSDTIPFSMGVDRGGTAYVLYRDGSLFRVSTKDASCEPTVFEAGQLGWTKFGMGFVAQEESGTDVLYVTESSYQSPTKGIGALDTTTMKLAFVAPYSAPLGNAVELTGTADGRLYAFALPSAAKPATLAEIDEASGAVLSKLGLELGNANSSFAFAFWGGDFYLFVSSGPLNPSVVHRYRPMDGSLVEVAKLSSTVVGAGVSTCAPL